MSYTKTKEQLQEAVNEIRAICKKHGIALIGTCADEGIFGEITIVEVSDRDSEWADIPRVINNTVEMAYVGSFCVSGIGDME